MEQLNLAMLMSALQIILIDLVLSGDNAVIIGMATRRLDAPYRKKAVVLGALGAILLRISFTGVAAVTLNSLPLLQFLGGLALCWIAVKLLVESGDEPVIEPQKGLIKAVKTIILADLVMSMDNVLAVGGASRGHLGLMVFGLLFSMPLLIAGSQLVASLMNRYGWIAYLGGGIIAWVAGGMIAGEKLLKAFMPPYAPVLIPLLAVLAVFSTARAVLARQAAHAAAGEANNKRSV
ncbi:MAG: TerC family protein [Firmicutes bacterium]|nr:TerC family protein [Bacillota bacterium]